MERMPYGCASLNTFPAEPRGSYTTRAMKASLSSLTARGERATLSLGHTTTPRVGLAVRTGARTPETALLVGPVLLKEVRKSSLQEKLPQVLENGRKINGSKECAEMQD